MLLQVGSFLSWVYEDVSLWNIRPSVPAVFFFHKHLKNFSYCLNHFNFLCLKNVSIGPSECGLGLGRGRFWEFFFCYSG